jgi:hypothetical protein
MPPVYHTSDPSRQLPSANRGPFHSRLYSSRVAASNSLVSENAAELRRNLARSQMLQTLPQDDDMLDDFPTLLGSDNPWRARRDPETDPWIQPNDRAGMLRDASSRTRPHAGSPSDDLSWHERSSNSLLRPYFSSSSTTRTVGRSDNDGHRFNPLLSPPSTSPFVRGVAPASSSNNLPRSISRDHTQPDTPNNSSQAAALSPSSLTTSPVFGLPSSNRRIPQHTRAFSSSVDPSRETATVRPIRAQSPVAWEDVIHSTAYSPLRADSSMSHQTDHDLRTRARQRPSLGPFRSPPPPSPEHAPRSPVPPRATPTSTYGSLDLSAYHEGPFRASLQRYVDLDRIRSRLNRLESIADNVSSRSASSSRPPLPPSLPPLRFDSDDDLLSAGGASSRTANSAQHVRTFSFSFWRDLLKIPIPAYATFSNQRPGS